MPTPIEENKSLVRRFIHAIERGDFAVIDEIVLPDYNDHLAGESPGRENLEQYFAGARSAFPDLELPIIYMVAEGDKVAALTGFQGTHKGSYGGFAAGKRPPMTPIEETPNRVYQIGGPKVRVTVLSAVAKYRYKPLDCRASFEANSGFW